MTARRMVWGFKDPSLRPSSFVRHFHGSDSKQTERLRGKQRELHLDGLTVELRSWKSWRNLNNNELWNLRVSSLKCFDIWVACNQNGSHGKRHSNAVIQDLDLISHTIDGASQMATDESSTIWYTITPMKGCDSLHDQSIWWSHLMAKAVLYVLWKPLDWTTRYCWYKSSNGTARGPITQLAKAQSHQSEIVKTK